MNNQCLALSALFHMTALRSGATTGQLGDL